jgi:hypothetical protein
MDKKEKIILVGILILIAWMLSLLTYFVIKV